MARFLKFLFTAKKTQKQTKKKNSKPCTYLEKLKFIKYSAYERCEHPRYFIISSGIKN